jgi:glutaredoxin
MKLVTLYTKPGCHLCEQVEQVVRDVSHRRRFRLERKNIEDDPAVHEQFKDAIPVVQVDGHEIARYRLTAFALEAALAE